MAVAEENSDPELAEMAREEAESLKPVLEDYEKKLTLLLLPGDPNDDKDIILEIRAGAGGEEAALFAEVLFRMYTRYADTMGWSVELMDSNPTELGGFKEVVAQISGAGVYGRMKFESGVHRVQRVPETEKRWTWISAWRISGSIPTGPGAPAGSTSTRRSPRCA